MNATAYTAVDQAEEEPGQTHTLHVLGPEILVEEVRRHGSGLIHFSTDYLFDGDTSLPYSKDDPPNPIKLYGQTKLAEEQAIAKVGGGVSHLPYELVIQFPASAFSRKSALMGKKPRTREGCR